MLGPYKKLPRAVHILCVGTFINRAGTLLLPFLALYLTQELDYSVKFASLAMGAIGMGSIIGALVGGFLADRVGRRPVMLMSLMGGAGMLVVFGYLRSPYAILSALVLFASLADMYRPAASAMIGDLVPSEQRSYAFGLMYFAINLGFPIGTVFGGMLAAVWFQGLFWVDAATAAIYAGIILLFIKETLPQRSEETPGDVSTPTNRHSANSRTAINHILRDVAFLIFCMASLLQGLMYVQSFSTLPMFMQTRGIDVGAYGKLIAINGVLIVLLQLPLTKWMKRYNRGLFVCLAAVITGLGFGLTGLAQSAPFFAMTIAIWTIGEIMIAPYGFAIVTDMAPVAYRARYLGVFTMCFASANMIGAPLGGFVLATGGGSMLWGGTLILGIVAAILYATIYRHMSVRPSA